MPVFRIDLRVVRTVQSYVLADDADEALLYARNETSFKDHLVDPCLDRTGEVEQVYIDSACEVHRQSEVPASWLDEVPWGLDTEDCDEPVLRNLLQP